MAEDTFIGDNTTILVPELIMMEGSQINAGAILAGRKRVFLDENVVIGYGAILLTATDTPDGDYMNDASPPEKREIREGPITVCANAFIGSGATIMPNVIIGANSVIGVGCFINHDVPSNMIIRPRQRLVKTYRDDQGLFRSC